MEEGTQTKMMVPHTPSVWGTGLMCGEGGGVRRWCMGNKRGNRRQQGRGGGTWSPRFLSPQQDMGLQLGQVSSRQELPPRPSGRDLAWEGVPCRHGCQGKVPLACPSAAETQLCATTTPHFRGHGSMVLLPAGPQRWLLPGPGLAQVQPHVLLGLRNLGEHVSLPTVSPVPPVPLCWVTCAPPATSPLSLDPTLTWTEPQELFSIAAWLPHACACAYANGTPCLPSPSPLHKQPILDWNPASL